MWQGLGSDSSSPLMRQPPGIVLSVIHERSREMAKDVFAFIGLWVTIAVVQDTLGRLRKAFDE
jgi:hypothetical protein